MERPPQLTTLMCNLNTSMHTKNVVVIWKIQCSFAWRAFHEHESFFASLSGLLDMSNPITKDGDYKHKSILVLTDNFVWFCKCRRFPSHSSEKQSYPSATKRIIEMAKYGRVLGTVKNVLCFQFLQL